MLGAIGYFHSQLRATYEVLKNFRDFFPLASLTVINDAGRPEIAKLAELFQATYHPYSRNITTGNKVDNIEIMIEWMTRFFKGIEQIHEEHFILLEDDVIILRDIDLTQIKGHMYGYNPNALLPEKVTTYLKQCNPDIPSHINRIWYSGCGGTILHTQFFKDIAKNEDWKKEMYIYGELSKVNSPTEQSWYFSDCCITYLCWRYGGTLEQSAEWGDLHVNGTVERYNRNELAIMHQYREHYNKPILIV